jgi:hypothetical protein
LIFGSSNMTSKNFFPSPSAALPSRSIWELSLTIAPLFSGDLAAQRTCSHKF